MQFFLYKSQYYQWPRKLKFYSQGSLEVCLFFRLGRDEPMTVRGSQEKFALEFLSVIIKSWGRGGGGSIKQKSLRFEAKKPYDFDRTQKRSALSKKRTAKRHRKKPRKFKSIK